MGKKFLKLKDNIVSIIVMTLVGFLLGFFITNMGVNTFTTNYELSVKADSNIEEYLTYEYFDATIEKIEAENKKYAKIDYESMANSIVLKENAEGYTILVQAKYFPSIAKKSGDGINYGYNRCIKYFSLMLSYAPIDIDVVDVKTVGYHNPYLYGGLLALLTLFSFSTFIMFANNIKPKLYSTLSIFSKEYWKSSFGIFGKVKNITLIATLFALMLLCKLIALPSGFGILGISFTYLFFSVITMIFGPISGIVIGFCSDMIGYFMTQSSYQIFFGYTLNAMLAGFTYGICFYKRRITYTKCLYARLFVNLFINVILGSIWWKMLYGLTMEGFYSYMFFIALPKNLIYLLPQSILLYIVLKIVIKPLAQFNLIDKNISENVSLI